MQDRIRLARGEDAPVIGDLLVNAYRAGKLLTPGDIYESTLRDVASRLDDTLVAVSAGHIVGTITSCGPGSTSAEIARADEWEFRFLAVDPRHWGRGVARDLIQTCEDTALAAGARAMVISVIDRNMRGHRFYPGIGYRRAPERDWSPGTHSDGTPVLLLAYCKDLEVTSPAS